MAELTDKVACRTPAEGRGGVTNIPAWKFDTLRAAILDIAKDEVLFKDLPSLVASRLTYQQKADLGSLGWHVTTVKLELEVRGEIRRTPGKGPQKLIRSI